MKLAYLTTCFGTPSHTFIRRELREFEKRGLDVTLLGVRRDSKLSPDSSDLVEATNYLYPLSILKILFLNLYFASVHSSRYWKAVYTCLTGQNESLKNRLKLLYHLFVSVVHAKFVLDEKITHVHAHFLNVSASITMFAARLSGVPYSITIHSAGEKNLPHVIAIAAKLKYAQSLLMISKYNIDYYNEIYPCKDKSKVVRCGMDIAAFEAREIRSISKPIRLLAVGRFVEKKGFKTLLESAKLLKNRGFEFKLDILGYGPDFENLSAYVSQNNLDDCVCLPGQASTEEVKQKMLLSDVVIVPSVTSASGEKEGIPVVLMEAMLSGIPVIATAHSGIPELVNASTGALIPERDSEALANEIEQFGISPEKIDAARSLIMSEFNISRIIDQRLSIFSK